MLSHAYCTNPHVYHIEIIKVAPTTVSAKSIQFLESALHSFWPLYILHSSKLSKTYFQHYITVMYYTKGSDHNLLSCISACISFSLDNIGGLDYLHKARLVLAYANAMALSLHHGQRVMLDHVGGFADGVVVKEVGVETFRLCRELIDGVILVSRGASIKDIFEEKRSILEPAGALALAGAEAYSRFYNLKDANVIAITSGANMHFDRLRLVTKLAKISGQQVVVLTTFMPEEHGCINHFSGYSGYPSKISHP